MTATASLVTTEMVSQDPIGVIRLDSSTKEYENYYWAKEALDELLILWLSTLADKDYTLSATRTHFKLEVSDDSREDRTRHIGVHLVVNV